MNSFDLSVYRSDPEENIEMKSRKSLLNRMLQTLIEEWGHEEVAAALSKTTVSGDHSMSLSGGSQLKPAGEEARPGAVGIIERASVKEEQREVLLKIAERYDTKQFLPSVADVREFPIMMGDRPVGMKDRREAFRVLLRSLMDFPVERLQQLSRTSFNSGPSELGPLSDAIAAAGARLPRQEHLATTDENVICGFGVAP